ncbi:MAG: leucine-rich repeat protein [Spirochaetaceae bacterium]|nr:leucine-rich repeat protein [Spirochaetaceae bacterium]
MKNMVYKHFRITIKAALICIAALMILSCGGGGGGGMVSFQDNPGIHNNGDAGGFGTGNQTGSGFDPQGQNIEDAEAGPLISQMAALDVTTVDIRLTVNNDEQPLIVADATTTTAVLPKIKPGYIVSGTATIHLANGTARTAVLDETEATLHGTLKFKVPYNYTANDLSGTQVASGTYFARDGINLAAQTVDPIAGWQCAEDGSIHYGGYVAGVRGDITLNAVLGDGAPALTATASQNVLYATATSFDTTMITITNVTGTPRVSDISSQLIASVPVADNPLNPTSYTLTIGFASGSVWFDDDTATSVTITDDSGATTSVPLTLKNKYSYVLLNHAGEGGTITRGPENAGYELTFANAKSIVSAYSTPVPTGRTITSFKDTATNTVYKESDFPIVFNSTNLNTRSITLQGVLGFTMTVSGGTGDGATHTGTETDPYVLKYTGIDNTDATTITVNVTGNIGSIIARSSLSGLTITAGSSPKITINKPYFPASSIPAEGLKFKITVRDYQSGTAGAADNDACLYSKETFWLMIPKPEATVSFDTGTGGSTAPSDQTITYGGYATAPADPTNTNTALVFGGWYAGTAGAGGTVTLASTAFDFATTPVTEDLTLYAKWLYTNFTGTAAEFLAADFVPNNNAATAYTITITSATNDQIKSIGKALGKSTDPNYKGVYVSLDLSGCGATEILEDAFSASTASWGSPDLATYLTGITLPNTLRKIYDTAFVRCTALQGTLTIPASVEYFGYMCFSSSNITGLSYQDTTSIWKKYDWDNNLMSSVSPTTCPTLSQLNAGAQGVTSWRKQP